MHEETAAEVSQLGQITRSVLQTYKEMLGRGPDRGHSHYAGPNIILCALEGTLTPLERTLTSIEEHARLRDVRMLVQDAARSELCSAIERITGRVVIASTGGFDTRADLATETFLLEPAT